ncbi:MAG: anti-phage ZorAB system protein ZorA, partial [bacterium]
ATGNLQLGQQIVSGLQAGLQEPLSQISGAVKQIGGSHSDAIGRVLTDAVAALTQRIQELFGGQIAGINQLQQQTIEALQAAVTKLGQMASNVDSAGQKATDAMANKLTEAIGAMEARQQVMNHQMAEFVGQIRSLVSQSQSETNQRLQETVAQLGGTVSEMISSLKEQAERAGQAHVERERAITENTTQAVSSLSGQVDVVLAKVSEVSGDIRTSVEAMRSVTNDAINRMSSGAETLYVAASDFAKAAQGVSGVLTQAASISEKLSQAAGTLGTSVRALETVVADYKSTREMLAVMLVELGAIVASAKKEASLTTDVLSRIEGSAAKLAQVQQQADRYLEGISEVLGTTHLEFAENMRKTVGEANRQFYDQLSTATALLTAGIQELEASLAEAGGRK